MDGMCEGGGIIFTNIVISSMKYILCYQELNSFGYFKSPYGVMI